VQGLPDGKGVIPIVRGKENYICGPNLKKYLREFKEVLNKYDCMTVGEAPMMTPDIALEFIEETPDQLLNMMFHFEHMEADSYVTSWIKLPFNLVKLKKAFSVWQEKLYGRAWNALYIENHDQPRIVNRYGSLKFRKESAKMLATMYICQRGTPFIYQGQEIGMTNIELPQLNMYEDISTINTYKLLKKFKVPQKMIINMAKYASRDNARTPVQWTDGRNAGFTAAQKPWFYINENYKYINVQEEENNKNSVLNYYRELLKIRSQNPVFIYGDYREHFPESKEIYSYERNYQGEKLLIICSFSDHVVEFQSPYNLSKAKRLIGNYKPRMNTGHMLLRPYECVVYSI
jgi:oligo-1,6-glucosidase